MMPHACLSRSGRASAAAIRLFATMPSACLIIIAVVITPYYLSQTAFRLTPTFVFGGYSRRQAFYEFHAAAGSSGDGARRVSMLRERAHAAASGGGVGRARRR